MLLVGDVGGDRLAVVGAVRVVLEAFVREHVGDPVQLLLLAEGQLERDEPAAEERPELVERAVEVGARLVLLVDEHHPRDAEGGAAAPRRLRADLDAVDGTDHEHGEVGDGEGGVDLTGEVGVAGSVEEVDLVRRRLAGGGVGRLPLQRGDRQGDRHLALDLLRLGVTDGGALVGAPRPWEHAGPVEQRLGERGLAATAVADEGDVSYTVGRRSVQSVSPLVRAES